MNNLKKIDALNVEVLNHSRHTSLKSQKPYGQANPDIKQQLQDALCAVPPPVNNTSIIDNQNEDKQTRDTEQDKVTFSMNKSPSFRTNASNFINKK